MLLRWDDVEPKTILILPSLEQSTKHHSLYAEQMVDMGDLH